MKSILFVVNVDWFFISHRLPIAKSMVKNGWKVGVACTLTGKEKLLIDLGIKVYPTNLDRNGTNFIDELKYIFQLNRIFTNFKPDVVHLITIKPVIYGGFVSYLHRTPKVANISGLGYGLGEENKGIVPILTWILIKKSMRLGKSKHFIFQNNDDLTLFLKKGLLSKYMIIYERDMQSAPILVDNFSLIKGVGIDLEMFKYQPSKDRVRLEVIFLGRLLKDKGVKEFVEAARILQEKYYEKVVFKIYGGLDLENRMSISKSEIRSYEVENYLIWEGFTDDVARAYSESDIVVFPSYREGLPKSLIEATAIGRPIITTDTPGCKECVVPGYNGYLVPVKDVKALVEAIALMLENDKARVEMGRNSRSYCERNFDVFQVIEAHQNIYNQLI